MIGTTFRRYEIVEELGHGGMSVVYRGVDKGLEREVAVKVLHAHLAKKAENRKRLHREAKAIARLKHANILEIYDYADEDAERAYIVMEYVDGMNLRQFIDAHGVMPSEFAAITGMQLCRALEHAHKHGIIHRDLKPENAMISHDGVVKLMDFGIAHIFDAETMTQTGSLLGSPAHMSPEMIEGEKIDERADIFALGTILYWLATGCLPFEGRNAPQILKRVLEGIFKNPESIEPKVDQDLGDIIRKCLAYEVEDRYQSVCDISRDLRQFAAKSGLGELDSALESYLVDPASEREVFDAAIVETLMTRATRALERDEPTQAFRAFNRILAYEPDNATVKAQLERLQRRGSRKYAIAAAAVVVALAGAAALFTQLPRDAPTSDRVPEATDASAALVAEATSSASARTSASEAASATILAAREFATARDGEREGARSLALTTTVTARTIARAIATRPTLTARIPSRLFRPPQANPERSNPDRGGQIVTTPPRVEPDMGQPTSGDPPPTEEPTKYVYKFKLRPYSAYITIDGKTIRWKDALTDGVELTAGKKYIYRVGCGNRACEEQTGSIIVTGAQTKAKDITLQWAPALITINTRKDALLYMGNNTTRAQAVIKAGGSYRYVVKFGRVDKFPKPGKKLQFSLHDSSDMSNRDVKEILAKPGQNYTFDARL